MIPTSHWATPGILKKFLDPTTYKFWFFQTPPLQSIQIPPNPSTTWLNLETLLQNVVNKKFEMKTYLFLSILPV